MTRIWAHVWIQNNTLHYLGECYGWWHLEVLQLGLGKQCQDMTPLACNAVFLLSLLFMLYGFTFLPYLFGVQLPTSSLSANRVVDTLVGA